MNLVIDIGNSSIVAALYQEEVVYRFSFLSDRQKSSDQYRQEIRLLLSNYLDIPIKSAIIGSVVPALTSVLEEAIKTLFDCPVLIIGSGVKTGIMIKADSQAEVGADLIAAAAGALSKYQCPLLIIDVGTATTISYLDHQKAFSGVIIAPGLGTCASALVEKTALLPEIRLEAPKTVLGRNSSEAMKAGVVLGHALMIDGFIAELAPVATIVLTGGYSKIIGPLLKHPVVVNENLVLDGLWAIGRKNENFE